MLDHLKDCLITIRRNPYQSVAMILALSQTFFIAYVFILVMIASQQVLLFFETQPQITAFFKPSIQNQIVEEAKTTIEGLPYVKKVTIVTKEQALETYRQDNQDDPLSLQLVNADILPASLEVSATSIESLDELEEKLNTLPGIDEVTFQRDVTEKLSQFTQSIRVIGTVLLFILGTSCLIQVIVFMSMKISARRQVIFTMQLLGASGWYIKFPFILEGMLYGIGAALISWIAVYTSLLYLTPWLLRFLGEIPLLPVQPVLMLSILGIGAFIGSILGSFASSIATQRFLR